MIRIGEHAAVLGGSLAGLAGAAVLAQRFERVTVVERDRLPRTGGHRKGVPQGRHVHVLLPGGLRSLADLLPGVLEDLQERGADVFDARALRFNIAGGSLLLEDADVEFIAASRPLIEGIARERVRSLTNVRFVEGFDACGLTMTPDRSRVTGARLRSRMGGSEEETVEADLVVDATGRGSRSPRWLAALGYPVPSEERIHVGVHYTTRLFGRAPETSGEWRNVAVAIPPGERRGAVALAVEGNRWIVTLIGILGERPPTDLAGFVEYARTLWTRDVHAVIADAPAIGEASTGAFPANVWRRYDRLRRFPGRYIVTGDAVCSLNPVYAQGMSVAFGEALTLAHVLDRHGLDRVGPRFFRQTKPITGAAWTMATGADLGHPGVQGPRSARWRLLNAYIGRVFGVAHSDPVVAEAALKVLGMVNPPQHVMHPRIASRVLIGGRPRDRRGPPPGRSAQAGERGEIMAEAQVNGVRLHYELHGSGEPLALVHGAWADATAWRFVVPGLAEHFRVLSYDRRGHSRSERPATQGSFDEDGDDLTALLEALDLAPAHVVTNSGGGNIALRLATRRPDLFRSLSCHEPALWGLLEQDLETQQILQQVTRSVESVARRIAQGDHEGAARQFVDEVAFGPGAWENALPPESKAIFIQNAPTFLDDFHSPNPTHIDQQAISRLEIPVRLTRGSESPPIFPLVIDRLMELIPRATRVIIEGAAHVPHLTTPERYVDITTRGARRTAWAANGRQ